MKPIYAKAYGFNSTVVEIDPICTLKLSGLSIPSMKNIFSCNNLEATHFL